MKHQCFSIKKVVLRTFKIPSKQANDQLVFEHYSLAVQLMNHAEKPMNKADKSKKKNNNQKRILIPRQKF